MALLMEPLFILGVLLVVISLLVARAVPAPDEPDEPFLGEIVDDFPPEVLLRPGRPLGDARDIVGETGPLDRSTKRGSLHKDQVI